MKILTPRIKAAKVESDKWQSIINRGAWESAGKTEIQAIIMRAEKEGYLAGLIDANSILDGRRVA